MTAPTKPPVAAQPTASPASPPTAADNRRGILALSFAMALFVSNDTLTKLAREVMPPGEVMLVRGVFATLCAAALAGAMGHLGRWQVLLQPKVLLRALIELGIALGFLTALGRMQLGDLTAVMQSAPLVTSLILAVTGLEAMGWRRWAAVLVGFLGVVLVARPSGETLDATALVALGAAALVALRDLLTRRIRSEVPTTLILMATSIVVGAGGLMLLPVEEWHPVDLALGLELAGAGVLLAAGNYWAITAFRHVDVAVVSPFRYSVILWAGLLGFLVFGERPDARTLLGAVLIAASGLYTVHRERVRARMAAPAAPPFGSAAGPLP